MALINQNSLIGITSITSSGASNVLTVHTNDTTERLRVTANGLSFSGTNASLDTSGNLTVGGNVSVGGTLTYEDVTNIDAVGIITAQSGIHVTDGSVGIGTDTSGSTKLKIESGSGVRAISLNAPTNGTYITFETAGTAYADIGAEKGVVGSGSADAPVINARGSRDISFRTNSSERLRIKSDGKIGIGTDNPSDELSVVSSLTADSVLRLQGGNSAGKGSGIRLMKGASAVGYIGPESWLFGSSNTSDTLVISQNAQANLSITSAGKVGINDASPIFKLDVVDGAGGANTGANADNPDALSVTGTNRTLTGGGANLFVNSNSDLAADTGGQIALSGRHVTSSTNSIVHATIKGAKENATSTNVNSYLAFGVSNHSAGGLVERLRITSAGKIGIGTNNPGTLLEVGNQSQTISAAITVSSGEIIGGGTGPLISLKHGPVGGTQRTHQIYSYIGDLRIVADSNENMQLWTGGSESLRIDSAGRLLIGSSSTQGSTPSTMQIKGAGGTAIGVTLISGNDENAGGLLLDSSGTNSLRIDADPDDNRNDTYIRFATDGTTRARIDSHGIKFGSDTAQANALDDYEEGTFTAILRSHSTRTSTSGYDTSTNSIFGMYTKVGRLVTITVKWNNLHNDARNHVLRYIDGLPFTSDANNRTSSAIAEQRGLHFVYSGSSETTNHHALYGSINGSTTEITLNASKGSSPYSGWPATHDSSSSQYFVFTLSYFAAS